MKYINDINIQEAIIHVLDSNGDEPILNEYKLDLDEHSYKYIYKQMEKCIRDDELKLAKFNYERNIVRDSVKEYYKGDINFIDLSKLLAQNLFCILKSNSFIPACDLIIASIITDQGPMIAILKLDFIKNIMHDIDFIENKVGISLKTKDICLPGSYNKIEKAAFINIFNPKDEVNLLFLDKNRRKNNDDEYGAEYWINNFLGCSQVISERDQTKNFINLSEKWIRQNYFDNAERAEEIRTAIRNFLEEKEVIDIDEFSKEIIRDPGEIENFKMLISAYVDEEIKIDKKYAEKKKKKIKLKIDNDIEINISQEAYKDVSKFNISKNGDGSINMIIKNVINYIEK